MVYAWCVGKVKAVNKQNAIADWFKPLPVRYFKHSLSESWIKCCSGLPLTMKSNNFADKHLFCSMSALDQKIKQLQGIFNKL